MHRSTMKAIGSYNFNLEKSQMADGRNFENECSLVSLSAMVWDICTKLGKDTQNVIRTKLYV